MKKEMLINVLQPEECRIAIVEDGVLEELYVERTSHESYTGNIYKGKIVNLEPAIQAAFVDFSVGRNGFLHVSDVEPQYYNRHQRPAAGDEPEATREPKRERGAGRDREERDRDREREPRREREERDPSASAPPPARFEERGREREPKREREERDPSASAPPPAHPEERGRERDRGRPDRGERERPDRSERGRRDRSEPRRFGEGLVEDDRSLPPRGPEPPARAPEPEPALPPVVQDEPRRARAETPAFPWSDVAPPRAPERDPRGTEFDEPRGRINRAPEPFDPELPPSRTQRGRIQPPPPPRPADLDADDIGRARVSGFSDDEGDLPPPPRPEREPQRPRGRGRGWAPRVPAEPELPFEPDADIEPATEPFAPEPTPDDRPEPPRRRGGRAAIRSRGGEREYEPTRPSPPYQPPAGERAPDLGEPDRPRERERDVERERDRGRPSEPEPTRERPKVHNRAGEPGYVPRRERHRASESPLGGDPLSAGAGAGWTEAGTEGELGADADRPAEFDEAGRPGSKLDSSRRRKRRRGRRRGERELPDVEGETAEPASELVDELAELPRQPRPQPRRTRRAEPVPELDEFDFGDESDDPEDAEFEDTGVAVEPRAATAPEEEIDPELEEEIRKEIEEIAELEREMGLRGTTEARPRRGDEPESGRSSAGRSYRGRGMVKPPIQEVFRRGDEVLVQVIKESIGTKGPTLSTYISIPGRYLVLMPGLNRVGVSRKIADEAQRRKLREIMNDLNPPKGLGFIVRTAGLERTKRELARDLAYLLRLWKVILRRIKKSKTPSPIYQESDMITRTIRDIFTSEIDTIWIDEPSAFERAQEFLRVVMPRFVNRLKLYEEREPLFHKYGIEEEIAKIQRRHVPLPEGGSIVIDQTEALVAIDVNSGNFRVENDAERTAYEMNLRAAKEIARQLRLRDLGGVIVNDFIDMRDERHRRGVEKALREAIKRDRARTKVLRMSQFGLIEMTRQRIRPSLKRSVYEDCGHCTGAGVVKTVESMSIDVMRLLALASHREDIRKVNICVAAPVATYLNNRKRREIARIEGEGTMTISIRSEDHVPGEHLQIECYDGNNSEVRLLPAVPAPGGRRGHGHRTSD
jgi:ribonuclease E